VSDRYETNPFLLILELFVIHAIQPLTESECMLLEQMTPALRSGTGLEGDWESIVRAMMGWDQTIYDRIESEWLKAQCKAAITKEKIEPEHFAVRYVDNVVASLS
jgi:hypothetical protein